MKTSKNFKVKQPRQKGFSLISLMVGSMISVTVMITALTFYKNHMMISTQMISSANHNSQLQFFLSVLQTETAQAGYGITKNNPSDPPALIKNSQSANANALYWAYDHNGFVCKGFRETHIENTQEGTFQVILSFLESTDTSCNSTTELDTMNWQEIEEITIFEGLELKDFLLVEKWLVQYDLGNNACSPFGLNIDTTQDRIMLEIKSFSKGVINGDLSKQQGTIQLNKCLSNIRA